LAEASLSLASVTTERPVIGAERRAVRGFCWGSLVAVTVHPVKVAIVEALLWVHEPLSATELAEIFDNAGYNLDMLLYHLSGLVRLEVIELTNTRHVRGAREKFFFLR